jgi:hypothetical protein
MTWVRILTHIVFPLPASTIRLLWVRGRLKWVGKRVERRRGQLTGYAHDEDEVFPRPLLRQLRG